MKKLLLILLLMRLLALPVLAEEGLEQQLGVPELEQALPDAAGEVYGELKAEASAWEQGLDKLLDWLGENAVPALGRALRSAVALAAILILCAGAESVSDGKGMDAVTLGGALGIAAVAAGMWGPLSGWGSRP